MLFLMRTLDKKWGNKNTFQVPFTVKLGTCSQTEIKSKNGGDEHIFNVKGNNDWDRSFHFEKIRS